MMAGIESNGAFIRYVTEHDLLEPAQLGVTFANGEKKRYDGIYTVHYENLAKVEGEALEEMHRRGYLRACHLLGASLGNVAKILRLKNERLSGGG